MITKGPILLLFLGFGLAGAKSPIAFCLWSSAVLLYSIFVFIRVPTSFRGGIGFWAFMAGIVVAQIYSLDRTSSLFWTTQILVYGCVWLAMNSVQLMELAFWRSLLLLGIATALLTTIQMARGATPYGFLPANPNFNAVWMAALVATFVGKPRKSHLEQVLTVWLSMLVILGQSRSGLLGLLTGVAYAARKRHSSRYLVSGMGLAVLAICILPRPWLLNRINMFEDGARLRIWTIALRGLKDYPWTGSGLGNFEIIYHRYAFPITDIVRFGRATEFAHNEYLQMLCEVGWPVSILFFLALCRVLAQPLAHHSQVAVSAKAILLTFCTAAIFNPIFKMPILAYGALLSAYYLLQPPMAVAAIKKDHANIISQTCHLSLLALTTCLVVWCGVRSYWMGNRQWDRVLAWNSKDAEAWHESALQMSNTREAIFYHHQAVFYSPYQIYYREGLARAFESIDSSDTIAQAMISYQKAIELAPKRATNYLAMARLYLRNGDPPHALERLNEARQLEPNYWECDLWQARCWTEKGNPRRALFILQNLVRRRQELLSVHPVLPDSPYAQEILGYDETVVQHEINRLRKRLADGVQ